MMIVIICSPGKKFTTFDTVYVRSPRANSFLSKASHVPKRLQVAIRFFNSRALKTSTVAAAYQKNSIRKGKNYCFNSC